MSVVCDGVCSLIHSTLTLPVSPCAHTELRAWKVMEENGLTTFMLIRSFMCLHLYWSEDVCVSVPSFIHLPFIH